MADIDRIQQCKEEDKKESIREIFFLHDLDYSIHELISDPDFISLERRMNRSSIFSIVGRTHAETWHSNFIAWLLNPQGEHGLGYFPIKRICYAMRKKSFQTTEISCKR